MARVGLRCKALTRTGRRCKAAPTETGYCFFHTDPKRASALGRIGGWNRHGVPDSAATLPTLETAIDLQKANAQLITDVYAGRIHPRIAIGLASLLNLQLRIIETSDHERRILALERFCVEADRKEMEEGGS